MASLIYLRSSGTRPVFLFFLLVCMAKGSAQNGLSFYAGAGGNTIISNYANAVEMDNKGKGKLSSAFNFEAKLKFSKHFSVSLNYLRARNHINVRFDDVQVTYFNRYTQTGGSLGNLTYVDDLYLYGNYFGAALNYELPFSKNKFTFSLGLNRGLFNSKMNKIKRVYESVPANSNYSDIDLHQQSDLTGTDLMALSASIRYDRIIYRDNIGLFVQAVFMYNFISYSYEFAHSSLGWEDRYLYTYGNGTTAINRYYTLSYHSVNCTFGIFYNINFKKNENR